MNIKELAIPEVKVIEPKVWKDDRGFFYESFRESIFRKAGISHNWVQDNHSKSTKGVLRGLHFQLVKPQAKLVRVIQGEVFDVAVDVRRNSPTFGKWVSQTLSDQNKKMMYIPIGFAHGFYTISDTAEFIYKCSDYYCQEGERGIIWNDPELAIPWPTGTSEPIISEKDLGATWLSKTSPKDLPDYEGA